MSTPRSTMNGVNVTEVKSDWLQFFIYSETVHWLFRSTLITNYMPISIITCFSPIFERIMYNHVIDVMNSNQIIYKCQAINSLVEKITRLIDSRDIAIGILLNMKKKTFDTVNHRIMMRKLYAYVIRGSILSWFSSYLAKRSQYVAFDESRSALQPIKCGIPKGSILSPLLLVIYINDICNVYGLLFCILYANDTTVIIKDTDIIILLQTLNIELGKPLNWLKSNKPSLNAHKPIIIIFVFSCVFIYYHPVQYFDDFNKSSPKNCIFIKPE